MVTDEDNSPKPRPLDLLEIPAWVFEGVFSDFG